jgi:hypothetical protein
VALVAWGRMPRPHARERSDATLPETTKAIRDEDHDLGVWGTFATSSRNPPMKMGGKNSCKIKLPVRGDDAIVC